MQLSIHNPEAHRLAKLLAEEAGETITTAVTEALRERLERVQRERVIEHGDLLHDENGLPK